MASVLIYPFTKFGWVKLETKGGNDRPGPFPTFFLLLTTGGKSDWREVDRKVDLNTQIFQEGKPSSFPPPAARYTYTSEKNKI